MKKYNFDVIKVFKYVTEPKAYIYRAIMRYLYDKHIRFETYTATFSDIYSMLLENEVINEDYNESNIHEAIRSLETWEAIHSRKDKQRGMTIEEFKSSRYTYQITELGTEIEELLIRIDELDEKLMTGLNSTKFSLLLKYVTTFREIEPRYLSSNDKILEIWSNVFDTHKALRNNATNYLYLIQEAERQNLFNSELFLQFKDSFIQYLGTFITEMTNVKNNIIREIKCIDDSHIQKYIDALIEANKPNSILNENYSVEKLETTLWNKWNELRVWFLGYNGSASDIDILGEKTAEAIRMITSYANRLSDLLTGSQSRIEDYRVLAKKFITIPSIEEAHLLFGSAFGVSHSRSLYSPEKVESNLSGKYSNDGEIWYTDLKPIQTPNMGNRGPRGKSRASIIKNNKKQQQLQLIAKLEKRREEEVKIKELIKDGKITLASLDKPLESFQRKVLFKWLARTSKTRKSGISSPIRTETGLVVRVRYRSNDRIKILSIDGVMTGPDVEFIVEGVGK
jgi:uncharacterized protein (TIGR02677 family)